MLSETDAGSPARVARTVRGDVPVTELGVVSSHEHVLIDLTRWLDEEPPSDESARVTLASRGWNLRDPIFRGVDNNRLDDADVAIDELREFDRQGGGTIIDLTSTGLDPQPERLRAISEASGVHIVLGCGFYRALSHEESTRASSVAQLEAEILQQVEQGVAGSGIRPGIIGEIGTSDVLAPSERRVLTAAARVQAGTGLALNVHTDPWAGLALDVISILEDAGAQLDRVVVSHLDHGAMEWDYLAAIAERGVILEFDGFGCEWYIDSRGGWLPRDVDRIGMIARLADAGHLDQIVIGMDTCRKVQLRAYGGWGYAHLPQNVLPMMRRSGFDDASIDTITRTTPHELLGIEP